ncbi:ABC transporter substrate-binding protein [Chitinimonas lacunae]|uniref:ABC transporter substrate-binding protein n=1 Tax=Chitinimonas lacunae TaxID=1963018 RepID=A0ABV8MQ05_9NEIS
MRKIFSGLVLGVASALLCAAVAAEPFVIGHIGPVSSQLRETALSSEETLNAFFDELNKKGGVNGNKVIIRHGDDAFDAQKHAALTREMIERHKPIAFLGAGGSGGPAELLKQNILADARIPLIAPISGAPALRNNPYIFHIRASWADELQKLMQQMQSLGHSRIGVLFQNDSDGKFGLFASRQEAKRANVEIVATGSYEKNTTEVAAAVKALFEANPTAILMLGTDDACAAFLKAYRKAGGMAQMYTPSIVGAKQLIADAGLDAARGTGISQVMPFIYTDASPIAKEYRAFVKRNKLNLGYVEFEYYIASKLLVEGLKKLDKNNSTGEGLMAALESIQNYNLGGFRLSFGPGNRVGSKFVEVTVIGPTGELIR